MDELLFDESIKSLFDPPLLSTFMQFMELINNFVGVGNDCC